MALVGYITIIATFLIITVNNVSGVETKLLNLTLLSKNDVPILTPNYALHLLKTNSDNGNKTFINKSNITNTNVSNVTGELTNIKASGIFDKSLKTKNDTYDNLALKQYSNNSSKIVWISKPENITDVSVQIKPKGIDEFNNKTLSDLINQNITEVYNNTSKVEPVTETVTIHQKEDMTNSKITLNKTEIDMHTNNSFVPEMKDTNDSFVPKVKDTDILKDVTAKSSEKLYTFNEFLAILNIRDVLTKLLNKNQQPNSDAFKDNIDLKRTTTREDRPKKRNIQTVKSKKWYSKTNKKNRLSEYLPFGMNLDHSRRNDFPHLSFSSAINGVNFSLQI